MQNNLERAKPLVLNALELYIGYISYDDLVDMLKHRMSSFWVSQALKTLVAEGKVKRLDSGTSNMYMSIG